MPTRDRPDLAAQAARYLLAQDYPNVELVIVDDGPPGLGDYLPQDPRIRHIHTGLGRSVGAMRNHACELARGQILVQWDDDDWNGPQRLSRQAAPIVEGRADITALRDTVMLDLPAWQFWMCDPELHRRLFVRDVHGGTLMFHRRVWERMSRYPDVSLAEDAAFLDQAVRRGCRLEAISAGGLFVYVRHEGNTWRFRCGESVDPRWWSRVDEPPLPDADRAFYVIRSRRATMGRATTTPLVSCIMPTHNRRPFVGQAIAYFLRQDYPAKELVVIDDGDDPIADLIPGHDSIRYRRLDRRVVLGAKRNLACDMGDGSIIVHWDDDDWMAPNRLTVQVRGLLREGIDISGVSQPLFYDPAARSGWLFAYPRTERPWVAGASLCYRKELWTRSRFPEIANGEDTSFTWGQPAKAVYDLSTDNCLVAIIHGANTSSKSPTGVYWRSRPAGEVEALLGPDLVFYRDLASSTRRDPTMALPGSTVA
jgi:glycosyltransferase involved in cell wall biosynthesis